MRIPLLLLTAITAEVAASLAMQAAVDQPLWYVLVVAGYAAGFGLLIAILRSGLPVGVAYAIWSASGVALTATLASFLFDQSLSVLSVGGIALIVVGVGLVELGRPKGHGSQPEAAR